eukprot:12577456-Alexandrium_andersonii.AAC.1
MATGTLPGMFKRGMASETLDLDSDSVGTSLFESEAWASAVAGAANLRERFEAGPIEVASTPSPPTP